MGRRGERKKGWDRASPIVGSGYARLKVDQNLCGRGARAQATRWGCLCGVNGRNLTGPTEEGDGDGDVFMRRSCRVDDDDKRET
jgi:hypothetical protein